jgi:pimeloyl-ACP methyl ester carboxylesterase
LIYFACVVVMAGCGGPPPPHVPRDPALRDQRLYFYPQTDSARPARAFVFFFGNDVGFWKPHRELCAALAGEGYAVTGMDMRRLLASLPDREPARDSAFAAQIVPIIEQSRHELNADSLPVVLAGHSLGAEIAIWIASHARVNGLVGALALSPGSRGHLRVTIADITNTAEPKDAESFAIADAIRALPPHMRLAIVRGSHDKYRAADSLLVAAGGTRTELYMVPLAGHALGNIIVARHIVSRALTWVLSGRSGG